MDRINLFHPTRKINRYRLIAMIALVLALCVIMLGAYTRLTNAGLGCPDWSGCYGKLVLTPTHHALIEAQKIYPEQPIILDKIWTEMAHRYMARLLGLLIGSLAILALIRRRDDPNQALWPPFLLVGIILFQAMLSMWTVTVLSLPLVVMGHLLGSMTIAAILCWIVNATKPPRRMVYRDLNVLKIWALIGLMILAIQIFLGAWTSTNYAALACPDFPYCQGAFFPHMNWQDAFNFTRPVGLNYEGGQLDMDARMTIHMAHRFGAFISTFYILSFALCLLFIRDFSSLRKLAALLIGLMILQVMLGISNVVLALPLTIAVAHNGVAALLLLTMVTILYRIYITDKQRWMI